MRREWYDARGGWRLRLGGSILWISACLVGCAATPKWERVPPPATSAAADGDARAHVLLDEIVLRMAADLRGAPVLELTYHRQVRILQAGAEELATPAVQYQPAFEPLVSFEGRTIAPDGKQRTFDDKDAIDGQYSTNSIMHTDARVRRLSMTPAVPGTLVEWRWTKRITDWRLFKAEQTFADAYPADLIRFEVSAPDGWEIDQIARRAEHDIELPPSVTSAQGRTRWVWERRDVPAARQEAYAPSLDQAAPTVIARLKRPAGGQEAPRSAAELSAWFYGWTRPPRSQDAAALARRITNGIADPEWMARRLYRWVRDEIDYFAVEVGVGGYRAHGADEVLKLRYGDCKDKANLLGELLAGVGIPSRLVLLYAHGGMPRPLRMFAGRNFNHVILEVQLPGRTLLVDPTSPVAAFGELPAMDQEADALPIDEHGAPSVRTPGSPAEQNLATLELELAPLGNELVGRVKAVAGGNEAAELRSVLRRARGIDRQGALIEHLGVSHAHLKAVSTNAEKPPEMPTPVQLSAEIRFDRALAGRQTLFRLGELLDPLVPSLPPGRRDAPVVFPARQRVEEKVRLRLEGLEVRSIPPPARLEGPGALYELRWEQEEGTLVVTRIYELREHVFEAAQYRELTAFFDRVLAAEARAIAIHQPEAVR